MNHEGGSVFGQFRQQLKDVMQENRDLQLAVDLYKSQVKVKDNYAKRVLKRK